MQHIILASNDLVEIDIVFKVILIVRGDSRFASLLPPFSHSQRRPVMVKAICWPLVQCAVKLGAISLDCNLAPKQPAPQ